MYGYRLISFWKRTVSINSSNRGCVVSCTAASSLAAVCLSGQSVKRHDLLQPSVAMKTSSTWSLSTPEGLNWHCCIAACSSGPVAVIRYQLPVVELTNQSFSLGIISWDAPEVCTTRVWRVLCTLLAPRVQTSNINTTLYNQPFSLFLTGEEIGLGNAVSRAVAVNTVIFCVNPCGTTCMFMYMYSLGGAVHCLGPWLQAYKYMYIVLSFAYSAVSMHSYMNTFIGSYSAQPWAVWKAGW